MNAPRIVIARTGERSGFLIATMPAERDYWSPPRLVTGDVHRISADEEPETWRAYLWPVAGGVMHTTQSCHAADAATPEELQKRLQKLIGRQGAWWK